MSSSSSNTPKRRQPVRGAPVVEQELLAPETAYEKPSVWNAKDAKFEGDRRDPEGSGDDFSAKDSFSFAIPRTLSAAAQGNTPSPDLASMGMGAPAAATAAVVGGPSPTGFAQQFEQPPSAVGTPQMDANFLQEQLFQLVADLLQPEKREKALQELPKHRESFPILPLVLWHSTCTMTVLLQEVINVYPLLTPPAQLSGAASNRVCNALALLQTVASHPETRTLFLTANVPMYLYPFLNTSTKSRAFEYLRLTSLGVIGALVKADDQKVILFLLTTEIIPLCLRIMETGSELSKTVATFILQKILMYDIGLTYICATPERFYAVSTVLANMVNDNPTSRLLKHIIRCYLRLSEHARARVALKQCLPESLRDNTFASYFQEDKGAAKSWLFTLLQNIGEYPTGQNLPQNTSASAPSATLGYGNPSVMFDRMQQGSAHLRDDQ